MNVFARARALSLENIMNLKSHGSVVVILSLVLGVGCMGTAEEGDSPSADESTGEGEQTGQESQASSKGCHGGECITVIGYKRDVRYVESNFYNGDLSVCSYHHLTVRTASGSLLVSQYSGHVCVGYPHSSDSKHVFLERRSFPENSRVCTTFAGTTACETIHS